MRAASLLGPVFAILAATACSTVNTVSTRQPAPEPEPYTFAPATPDGTGKFFHKREIAKVMGHPAIGWLERDEREKEEARKKAAAG